MKYDILKKGTRNMVRKFTIGVVGNPNCGKTTLFNALTGGKQRVGNWPGVTVERKVGTYTHNGMQVELVDLPGIYSMSISSLDEKVARDYILRDKPDLLVNIVDASNLERNLYLTMQLLEMNVPIIIVLNMMDVAARKKMKVDVDRLASLLDCPVMCTVANKNDGIDTLKDAMHAAIQAHKVSGITITYGDEVEDAITHIRDVLQKHHELHAYDLRWSAVKLLEQDIDDDNFAHDETLVKILERERHAIEQIIGDEPDIAIADGRYGFINGICKHVVKQTSIVRKNISDMIDRIVLNRVLGVPIFFLTMYLTFWVTINFSGVFTDFFDRLFGTLFVDGFGAVLSACHAPEFLRVLLAEGIGGGIQTIATFIPPIFFMFLCLALLEDSGYMARAAFVMDRFMRVIGLPGKAFVPMLIGFGCNVPAIMATRTLDDQRDRIMTVMMNPFMSCGARMPVYALFVAIFFPDNGGVIIFALYMIGIALAIMTGFLLKHTVLAGEASSFIMELPPYHIPTMRGVLIHTWNRLRSFVVRAGRAILFVIVILSFINSFGTDGSFGNNDTDTSVLSTIGRHVVPVFKPMGMQEDNWPAAVGIFAGIFAKEAVIGAITALYDHVPADRTMNMSDGDAEIDMWGDIQAAFRTIPEGFAELSFPFVLGSKRDVAQETIDIAVSDMSRTTFKKYFDGKAGVFAYLLMVLLYMPCVAAIAAVYREVGLGWTIFSCGYLSGLAWLVSTLFYQTARFVTHPLSSAGWIAFCLGIFVLFFLCLKKKGSMIKG